MDRPDEEIDTDLATSAGNSEKGYASAIAETWDHLEETKETQTELEEIFAPHREALAASGHTPKSWIRMAIGVSRELEEQLSPHPEAMGNLQAMSQRQHLEAELQRFTKAHPDADRYRMGEWLSTASPPRSGETTWQAFERAYKGYKGVDRGQGKVSDKKGSPPNQDRRDDIEAAWDQLGHGNYMRSR